MTAYVAFSGMIAGGPGSVHGTTSAQYAMNLEAEQPHTYTALQLLAKIAELRKKHGDKLKVIYLGGMVIS